MDGRTPSEGSDGGFSAWGIDEELQDLGLEKEERTPVEVRLLAGVASGFLPPSWLGLADLGCLRSAIVLAWSGIGCLLAVVTIFAAGGLLAVLGVETGSELGVNVSRIAAVAAFVIFILAAFFGSVVTIRRSRPWKRP